jgi:predicted RNA binding protein YcfA (HicA-like mRNA interferase family)
VANAEKLLGAMRANPRDWRIDDVVAVCRANGVDCTPPRHGSHFKVKHVDMPDILTIPSGRPIKPIYIRELVRFIDTVRKGKP